MTWDGSQILVRALVRDLLICIGLALVFTILGVYDSDNMAWQVRVIFWTVVMCLGGAAVSLAEPFVFGSVMKNRHPIIQVLTIALIISFPITVFLAGLNTGFEFIWSIKNWAMQYVGVLLISVIIVAGRYLVSQFLGQTSNRSKEGTGKNVDKFFERLPVKFRASKLYGVSSEGHYLRVHTDNGSALILMRISDAIKELDGADGLQVHRSWWVAREGVADTKNVKGRRFLILKNGETAPVSRSYLNAVKSANLDK
jgi:hypothetical protein